MRARLANLPSELATFAAAAVAAGVARAVVTTYLPVLLDEVRSSPGIIGTVMVVNAVTGFAVPLVVGAWSDRAHPTARGRRIPFIAGGCVVAVAGLVGIAFGAGVSILALTAAGTVAYVGINAITTAHRALVPDCFDKPARARATSAQEIALLAGSMVGLVGGGLATGLGSWAPFALAAVAVPLLAGPTVARVREPRQVAGREAVSPLSDYAGLLRYPGVRALLGAQVLWMLGYAAVPAFFVLYADKVLDIEPAPASAMLAGFGAVTGLTMLRAGRVRDPARYVPLLCVGVVMLGAGFLTIAAAPGAASMVPGLVAAAAGFGLISTIGFPLLTTLAPAGEEGEYTGLYFSVRAIASAVALPAVGWTIAALGTYRALFWFGGAVTIAAVVPLMVVGRHAGTTWDGLVPRLRAPGRAWLARWALAVAGLAAGLLALGGLIAATPLQELDESLFRTVNSLGPGGDLTWEVLNPHLRNYVVLSALPLALAALVRPSAMFGVALMLVVADALAAITLQGSYAIWDRPRPEEALRGADLALHGTWAALESYPSGHMVVTTALAAVTMLVFPRWRWPLGLYVAAVGFTRMVFGAHYPFDVLSGVALGLGTAYGAYVLALRIGALEPHRARERPAGVSS